MPTSVLKYVYNNNTRMLKSIWRPMVIVIYPFQMSTSRTLAPSNISRIVNLWLSLVPDCLRSTSVESSGYDQYVRNAQSILVDVVRKCQGFEWSVEATPPQERFDLTRLKYFDYRCIGVGSLVVFQ